MQKASTSDWPFHLVMLRMVNSEATLMARYTSSAFTRFT